MKRKEQESTTNYPKFPPAQSDEERDIQMGNLAYAVAEERMRNGTASSSEIVYFLKLNSKQQRLENEQLRKQNELLQARVADIESNRKSEELYEKVIASLREYSGYSQSEEGTNYEN